jgi:hypothetical protein
VTTVIHLRGTNEPPDARPGISRAFLDALDPRFRVEMVTYPADYGVHMPYDTSAAYGRTAALELLYHYSGTFVLAGYSQGADIAGDLAREIAAGRIPGVGRDRLAAVVLIADPKRPEGATAPAIPVAPGYGIAGQRPIPGVRVWWGTASRDGISALTGDNPLRSLADLSRKWTLSPAGWTAWLLDMYGRFVVQRDLQVWWAARFRPGRLAEAAALLAGYLFGGTHTDDYLHQRICVLLAETVNREVR